MKIAVITKHGCPRCDQLKTYLGVKGISYEEWDVNDAKVQKELLSDKSFIQNFCEEDGCTVHTPVVYDMDEKQYYAKELFGTTGVRKQFVDRWVSK